MALPDVPSHWTEHTSDVEVAEWLLRLREAAIPKLAVYPNMIAFTDSGQKQRYVVYDPFQYKAYWRSQANHSLYVPSDTLTLSSPVRPTKSRATRPAQPSAALCDP